MAVLPRLSAALALLATALCLAAVAASRKEAAAGWRCSSDAACQLNGKCGADGACSCDPGWAGANCSALRLGASRLKGSRRTAGRIEAGIHRPHTGHHNMGYAYAS